MKTMADTTNESTSVAPVPRYGCSRSSTIQPVKDATKPAPKDGTATSPASTPHQLWPRVWPFARPEDQPGRLATSMHRKGRRRSSAAGPRPGAARGQRHPAGLSEADVQSQRADDDWATVPVAAGIREVLEIAGHIDATRHRYRVIGLSAVGTPSGVHPPSRSYSGVGLAGPGRRRASPLRHLMSMARCAAAGRP
jgi:hypothetical protein